MLGTLPECLLLQCAVVAVTTVQERIYIEMDSELCSTIYFLLHFAVLKFTVPSPQATHRRLHLNLRSG